MTKPSQVGKETINAESPPSVLHEAEKLAHTLDEVCEFHKGEFIGLDFRYQEMPVVALLQPELWPGNNMTEPQGTSKDVKDHSLHKK